LLVEFSVADLTAWISSINIATADAGR
jgi:hypothetical protein